MSIVMDEQDLRGYLRGLSLVTVIRCVGGPVKCSDFRDTLQQRLGDEISQFVSCTAAFTGADAASIQSAVDDLYACDDDFVHLENLNMQLGLLSKQPIPIFPFVTETGVCDIALWRPFMDAARNLIHAAVRLRMQTLPATQSAVFWPAASRFICRMGGDGILASALANATILDVASDIVFFNNDASDRATTPILAERIRHVLGELAAVAGEMKALAALDRSSESK